MNFLFNYYFYFKIITFSINLIFVRVYFLFINIFTFLKLIKNKFKLLNINNYIIFKKSLKTKLLFSKANHYILQQPQQVPFLSKI